MTTDPRLAGFEPLRPPFPAMSTSPLSSEADVEVDERMAERAAARHRVWPRQRFGPREDSPWPVPQWQRPTDPAEQELRRIVRFIVIGTLSEWPFQVPEEYQVRSVQGVIDRLDATAAEAGLVEVIAPILDYLRQALAAFGADPVRPQDLYLAVLDIGIMLDDTDGLVAESTV